jgi:glycine/D-amino acid oxidase-like deaminating enzyme
MTQESKPISPKESKETISTEDSSVAIIIGGGIAGVSAALQLAEQGQQGKRAPSKILLFEQAAGLLSETSDATPCRPSLGAHYPDINTAIHSLEKVCELVSSYDAQDGFLMAMQEAPDHPLRSCDYIVSEDSTHSVQEFESILKQLRTRYADLVAKTPTLKKYFGEPDSFYRKLEEKEYPPALKKSAVQAIYRIPEHIMDWPRYKQFLIDSVRKSENIELHLETRVVKIEQTPISNISGYVYVVTVEGPKGRQTFTADFITNATWYAAHHLNKQISVAQRDQDLRLKGMLTIKDLPEILRIMHHQFRCFGGRAGVAVSFKADGSAFVTCEEFTNIWQGKEPTDLVNALLKDQLLPDNADAVLEEFMWLWQQKGEIEHNFAVVEKKSDSREERANNILKAIKQTIGNSILRGAAVKAYPDIEKTTTAGIKFGIVVTDANPTNKLNIYSKDGPHTARMGGVTHHSVSYNTNQALKHIFNRANAAIIGALYEIFEDFKSLMRKKEFLRDKAGIASRVFSGLLQDLAAGDVDDLHVIKQDYNAYFTHLRNSRAVMREIESLNAACEDKPGTILQELKRSKAEKKGTARNLSISPCRSRKRESSWSSQGSQSSRPSSTLSDSSSSEFPLDSEDGRSSPQTGFQRLPSVPEPSTDTEDEELLVRRGKLEAERKNLTAPPTLASIVPSPEQDSSLSKSQSIRRSSSQPASNRYQTFNHAFDSPTLSSRRLGSRDSKDSQESRCVRQLDAGLLSSTTGSPPLSGYNGPPASMSSPPSPRNLLRRASINSVSSRSSSPSTGVGGSGRFWNSPKMPPQNHHSPEGWADKMKELRLSDDRPNETPSVGGLVPTKTQLSNS